MDFSLFSLSYLTYCSRMYVETHYYYSILSHKFVRLWLHSCTYTSYPLSLKLISCSSHSGAVSPPTSSWSLLFLCLFSVTSSVNLAARFYILAIILSSLNGLPSWSYLPKYRSTQSIALLSMFSSFYQME